MAEVARYPSSLLAGGWHCVLMSWHGKLSCGRFGSAGHLPFATSAITDFHGKEKVEKPFPPEVSPSKLTLSCLKGKGDVF